MKRAVVTLCGSTRFKDEFIRMNEELTLKGLVVFSVGLFGRTSTDKGKDSNKKITDYQKNLLDEIHKQKIEMSDSIFVINPGGYIGKSTKSEIEYAKKLGKIVNYMVDANLVEQSQEVKGDVSGEHSKSV